MAKTSFNDAKGQIIANSMIISRHARASQLSVIKQKSPFSDEVNECFAGYDEFYHLYDLGLKEAIVTRRSLIRDIDFDLYIECRQATNRELMLKGNAPFAYNEPDGEIDLHHIGQILDAPFAELTKAEHMQNGNNSVLHNTKKVSWRSNIKDETLFSIEKKTYWKMRAKGEVTFIEPKHTERIKRNVFEPKKRRKFNLVDSSIKNIFNECSLEDLKYYRNMADNMIMIREAGAKTLEDFIIKNQKNNTDESQIICTRCGSKKYQEYGTYKSGLERVQRYRCKNCGKTYSILNNSIVSGCKFTMLDWLKFIDCLYNGFSIKKTANLCDISEQTAHENRLRLFYALKLLDDKVKLQDNIVIDETYFNLSYKGNHSKSQEFVMNRNPHKRGNDNHIRGLSKEKVCVACALDEFGNSVARIAGLGNPTHYRLGIALKGSFNIESDICIYSDMEGALGRFAKEQGFTIHQGKLIVPNSKKKNISYSKKAIKISNYLQKINNYHSRLKDYIGKAGVSSDLLSGYLYLFSWKERNKNQPHIDSYKELLSILTMPGMHKDLDYISSMLSVKHFHDTVKHAKKRIKDFERAKDMFDRCAKGESQKSVAESYGVSRSTVAMSNKKYKELGYGYKTEQEKRKEEKLEKKKKIGLFYTSEFAERNKSIYDEFFNSTMSNTEYYEWAAKKYKISVASVKRIIATQKRIQAYKDVILIYENYEYKDSDKICSYIYNRYNELIADEKMYKKDVIEIIVNETGYPVGMATRIISETKKNGSACIKKMPLVEVINRDKAIYRDYMDWSKTEKEFWGFAEEKYKIKKASLQAIINMMWEADPKRYVNKLD